MNKPSRAATSVLNKTNNMSTKSLSMRQKNKTIGLRGTNANQEDDSNAALPIPC